MDIRMFQYFTAVVQHKQITVAAEALHISQPALSKAIKTLEAETGCQLFERSTRKLTLTEPGQILYKQISTVLREYNNVFKIIEDVQTIGTGTLNIGIIESFKYWIPSILKQFKYYYPDIAITIQDMGPKEIENSLKNYKIHLGVTSIIYEENKNTLKSLNMYQDNLILITPANHRLTHLQYIDIAELKHEKLIHSFSGYMVRDSLIDACKKAGFTPTIDYETEDLETAIGLVKAGLGVSVIPESYIKSNPSDELKLIYFKNKLPKSNVYITHHATRYLSPAIYDFIANAQSILKENDLF